MRSIKIRAVNNDDKEFIVENEPGVPILELVNRRYEMPKREGIPFICRQGACKSCVIAVPAEDADMLEPPSRLEQRALNVGRTTIDKGFRLACMSRFKES